MRRLLDMLGKESPTIDTVNGEGIYALASKAGFHHSYGNSIWMGGKDCTESVYRLAMGVAQWENEAAARLCDEQRRQYEQRVFKPESWDFDPSNHRSAIATCDFLSAAIRKRYAR